jgi:hypothetical protein
MKIKRILILDDDIEYMNELEELLFSNKGKNKSRKKEG